MEWKLLKELLIDLYEVTKTVNPRKSLILPVLRAYGIPRMTEALRAECQRCRAPVMSMLSLSNEGKVLGPHDRSRRSQSLGFCSSKSTMILKTLTTFETRTHGHHFREQYYAHFEILDDQQFIDILWENRDAIEPAIKRSCFL